MLKKYKVENLIDTAEMYRGEQPHSPIRYDLTSDGYAVAENADEAISITMDCICDSMNSNQYDRNDDEIIIYDENGEIKEAYYNFIAEEIDEEPTRVGIRCTEDAYFSDLTYEIPEDAEKLAKDLETYIFNKSLKGGFVIVDKDTNLIYWKTTFNILRQMLGARQTDITELMHIPRRTVQDWEAGEYEPPEYVQLLVAEKMRSLILKPFTK